MNTEYHYLYNKQCWLAGWLVGWLAGYHLLLLRDFGPYVKKQGD
jgi:hypothetical protein